MSVCWCLEIVLDVIVSALDVVQVVHLILKCVLILLLLVANPCYAREFFFFFSGIIIITYI